MPRKIPTSTALVALVVALLLPAGARAEGARYLIITPEAFEDAIRPLAVWKTLKGLRTRIVTTAETGYSTPEIRTYIINAATTWDPPPEYVLLVGDMSQIPMPSMGTNTDVPYGSVDGDTFVEIHPGRFPAQNVDQVTAMVEKTLLYERTPVLDDPGWYGTATMLIAEDHDDDDWLHYYGDANWATSLLETAGWEDIHILSRSYTDDSAGTFSALVEDGIALSSFHGVRGGLTGCDWPGFGVDPNNIPMGPMPPIILSYTCMTLAWNANNVCGGEMWMRAGTAAEPRGAVAFVGQTRDCSYCAHWRSALRRGFFGYMFEDSGPDEIITMGEAVEAARQRYWSEFQLQEQYYASVLYGDPELNLRTAPPQQVQVSHPPVLPRGQTQFTSTVSIDGVPRANAQVCAVSEGGTYAWGSTGEDGAVTFDLDTSDDEFLYLTVTGRDLVPYEGTIDVLVETAPQVDDDDTVDDDPPQSAGGMSGGSGGCSASAGAAAGAPALLVLALVGLRSRRRRRGRATGAGALLLLLPVTVGCPGDPGTFTPPPDLDQDGWSVDDGDCDDADPNRHPGAEDVFYDGVDMDCSGSDFDADGDGYDAHWFGGDDCDDADPALHPGAAEVCADGIDTDCSGDPDDGDTDADGDGFVDDACSGGSDCDDDDPAVRPGLDVSVPGDHATVQAAATAVCSGSTITVDAGTFEGNVDAAGKSLTVVGAGADATILVGDGAASVVVVGGVGAVSTVEGLTLQGGSSLRGGGLACSGMCTVRDVTFSGNTAHFGGGLALDRAEITVEGCSFAGNSAAWGGGLWVDDSNGSISGSTWTDNEASRGGGAMAARFSGLDVSDVEVVGGEVTGGQGGGFHLYNVQGSLSYSSMTGIDARIGGALMIRESTVDLLENTITGNDTGWGGSGLYCWDSTLTSLETSDVSGNTASDCCDYVPTPCADRACRSCTGC